ncbi:hypothetical protein D3C76_1146600 [compost metagenome]
MQVDSDVERAYQQALGEGIAADEVVADSDALAGNARRLRAMGVGKQDAGASVHIRCASRCQPDPPVRIVGHVQQGVAAQFLGALEPTLGVDQAWAAHWKEAQRDDLLDHQFRPVADAIGNEQVDRRVVGVVRRSG